MKAGFGELAVDAYALLTGGARAAVGAEELQTWFDSRRAHLESIRDERGLQEAVDAEAASALLQIMGRTIDEADAQDARMRAAGQLVLRGLIVAAL